jgi:hypothetical protein
MACGTEMGLRVQWRRWRVPAGWRDEPSACGARGSISRLIGAPADVHAMPCLPPEVTALFLRRGRLVYFR